MAKDERGKTNRKKAVIVHLQFFCGLHPSSFILFLYVHDFFSEDCDFETELGQAGQRVDIIQA
jgi:hypothetical protein